MSDHGCSCGRSYSGVACRGGEPSPQAATATYEPLRVERARHDLRQHLIFMAAGVGLIVVGAPVSIFGGMPFVIWMMTGGGWGALYLIVGVAFALEDRRIVREWEQRKERVLEGVTVDA